MAESFVIYKSFHDALITLNDMAVYAEVMFAINEYALNGKIPELQNPISKALFISFKPQIEASQERYEKACEGGEKGGRPERFSEKDKLEIIADYDNGLPIDSIADKYDCSKATIYRILNVNNSQNSFSKPFENSQNPFSKPNEVLKLSQNLNYNDNDNENYNYNDNQNDDDNENSGITTTFSKSLKNHSLSLHDSQISQLEEIASKTDNPEELIDYALDQLEEKYKDKPEDEKRKLKIYMLTHYLLDFEEEFKKKKDNKEKTEKHNAYIEIYKNPPDTKCKCGKQMIEKPDQDGIINYTAYACSCGYIRICEGGVWKDEKQSDKQILMNLQSGFYNADSEKKKN